MEVPVLQRDLLRPPCIMCILLDAYEGQGDDFIGVVAYHDFGIHSMYITIRDGEGKLIENGEMSPYPENPDLWEYLPKARSPLGTKVIVQVTAMDCMGGIGRGWVRKILGEDEW